MARAGAAPNPVGFVVAKRSGVRSLLAISLGVRAAAVRLFAAEGAVWPPEPVLYPKGWRDTLEALALELGYPVRDATGIINAFEQMVALIASPEEGDSG